MTLLAMWLGEQCVAMATDSRMVDLVEGQYKAVNDAVPKLHRVTGGNAMFAIGFGEGASDWLSNCQCSDHRNYPEHWRDCSQAKDIDELEEFVKHDLQTRDFEPGDLTLDMAGINKGKGLEAFILNGAGRRTRELRTGCVVFSPPILKVQFAGLPLAKDLGRWFEKIKEERKQHPGEIADGWVLKETGEQVLDWCKRHDVFYIGGHLQFEVISG